MRLNRLWLVVWLVMASPVHAAVIYVKADAQGTTTSGTSWTNAYTDLQMALAAASGTYKLTTRTDRWNCFVTGTESGRALAPIIYVTNGTGMYIPNGGSLRLRSTAPGAPSPTAQLIIRNVGELKLTLGTPSIAAPFKITKLPNTNVSTGSQTRLEVSLSTQNEGTFSKVLSFATSDPKQPNFSVTVNGIIQIKPKILYVRSNSTATAQTPNYGLSWATAYRDLQLALKAAQPGNEIWVAAGTYKPTQNYDQTISFVMPEDVGIYGGFAGTETTRQQRNITMHPTILSGKLPVTPPTQYPHSYHVVIGGNFGVLEGFTITDGHSNERDVPVSGGGMYNTSVTLSVNKCVFGRNFIGGTSAIGEGKGGAVYNGSVVSTFSNCVFETNTLMGGYAYPGPRGMGGAIYNDSLSSSTITNSIFTGNRASGGEYAGAGMGGAIYNEGRVTLTNCTFAGNRAVGGSPSWTAVPDGHGGYDFIYGQPGPGYGGALYSHGGVMHVTNCIFWTNSMVLYQFQGKLYYSSAIQNDSATMIYRNSDIEGCRGSGSTWKWSYGGDGGGNFEVDPWFVNQANPAGPDGIWITADDGLRLRSNSPCIDHGTSTGAPATDILGKSRISIVDMGCYEFQYGNAAGQWARYR